VISCPSQPVPLPSHLRYALSWEAATERFISACMVPSSRAKSMFTRWDRYVYAIITERESHRGLWFVSVQNVAEFPQDHRSGFTRRRSQVLAWQPERYNLRVCIFRRLLTGGGPAAGQSKFVRLMGSADPHNVIQRSQKDPQPPAEDERDDVEADIRSVLQTTDL
jgi:hypothetical protein